jgi:hypothetical protein
LIGCQLRGSAKTGPTFKSVGFSKTQLFFKTAFCIFPMQHSHQLGSAFHRATKLSFRDITSRLSTDERGEPSFQLNTNLFLTPPFTPD